MKIAVTGPNGQLGSELVKQGCVPIFGSLMSETMLSNIEIIKPDVIINCAAMTNVDACEKDILMAVATNVQGVEWLSYRFGRYLVHISTDYIFDGTNGPYGLRDTPSPINIYGWSKLGGELVMARRPGSSLVIRTTVLFSATKNNFVSKVVAQLAAGQAVKMYNHEIMGTPTYVPFLAAEIMRMVRGDYKGLAHVAGKRVISRLEFARMIAKTFGYDTDLIQPAGNAPGGAPRPMRAGLICDHSGYNGVRIHDPIEGLKELANQAKDSTWK